MSPMMARCVVVAASPSGETPGGLRRGGGDIGDPGNTGRYRLISPHNGLSTGFDRGKFFGRNALARTWHGKAAALSTPPAPPPPRVYRKSQIVNPAPAPRPAGRLQINLVSAPNPVKMSP